MPNMAVLSDEKLQADLRTRAAKIAALRSDFAKKMQNLRGRQRALLERVIKRMDQEEVEKVRKSLQ